MKFKVNALAALTLLCASSAHATSVFINEIHYDNTGGDVGEFFEIAAPVGTDLTDWSIVLYNGSNGTSYNTIDLATGTLIQDGNYSFVAFTLPANGLQNGAPDGLALINNSGAVVQFLSYEGTFAATNGPANGVTSVDIGVSEPSSTPAGESLQLTGTGSVYGDFTWAAPATETPNAQNIGQTITVSNVDNPPSIVASSPADGDSNVAIDANINLTFSEDVTLTATNPVSCLTELSISVTISGSGNSYVINPDSNLPAGDTCTFSINASDVTDLDGDADNLQEDFSISFSVFDPSIVIDLVINEFLADPASDLTGDANGDGTRDSTDDEFFELVNNGGDPVDLSGWTYSDAGGVKHVFPADSIVEPGCAIVVFGGGAPQGVFGGALVQTSSNGSLSLNNGGDSIIITNGVTTIDITYGSASINQSLTLNPDVTGTSFSPHSDIVEANGALFSPGTKLDGTKFSGCTIPDFAPTVVDFTPANGATEVSVDSTLSISFSEEVVISQWPALSCTLSGDVAITGELSGSNFSLTPASNLGSNETCTFTLPASSVTDVDGTPDTLANDFVSSFTTAELLTCNDPTTFISAIQGSGDASSFVDQIVTVQAVVTAFKSDSPSFFIQEEQADYDVDPSTSEGLYVYNTNPAYTPAMGDLVTVRGVISEFFGLTEMTISSAPAVCDTELVTVPVELSLPLSPSMDFEALEGMLVTNAQPLTVTNVFLLGRFGQATLSNGLIFNPNNISIPGSAENDAIAASNNLNKVILDDGSDVQNPAVVPYPTGGLSAVNTLRIGDTVSSLVAVVDYSRGNYLLVPAVAPTFVASNPRTNEPDLTLGNLKVASLNVLNFFNTIDTGASICGPSGNSGCRGADDNGVDGNGLTEFDRQKVKTIAAITAIDADILGLMEIENDGYGPESAIVELVAGINAVMGANTYAIVKNENDAPIGTDAIAVALIYKPASVSLSGSPLILNSDNSISDGDGPLFNDQRNRPSLIQKFALVENGEELVISVNHLKSKGSGCGNGDDSPIQGNCNLTRTRAAQALVAFLAENFADTPTLIIGDLNAYALEDPIMAITAEAGPAYTDLAKLFGGDHAYSYSFDGELGYLDHALASPNLVSKVVDTTEWHINADEPIVLDYNFEFISTEQIDSFFSPDAYRMSDHDPVIISLLLEPELLLGDLDGDGDVDFRDVVTLTLLIRRNQITDLAYDFNDDGVVNTLDVRVLRTMCTRNRCSTRG